MNILLKSLTILLLISFSLCSNIGNQTDCKKLEHILALYMDKYHKIDNPCDEKPYYKIQFSLKDSALGFWVAAYLGRPGLVPPSKPGEPLIENPIEIKGYTYFNKSLLIIYDYKNSDGYGLYEPSKLSCYDIDDFFDIQDSCANVWYPEALYYTIAIDSIYLTDKRDAFQLK